MKKWLLIAMLLTLVLLTGCTAQGAPALSTTSEVPPISQAEPAPPDITTAVDGILQVIFFDVGQADCTLILAGESAMLIDAGNIGQDSLILGYLAEYGVTKLDYLAATHPHSDHIGSMAAVVQTMERIGTLLMPDVIHTTQTFEGLLDAIEEKDVPVTIPEPGETFALGDATVQVLAPNSTNYASLNDYSIVLRIVYGQTSFLFTGDAEELSEQEQLAAGFDLSADVLKVGHHGSDTSTTQRYLDAVAPSYAVISAGADNTYGHPHSELLSRLNAQGSTIYRTDLSGTVVLLSDGATLTPSTLRSDEPTNIPPDHAVYIGNKNSKVFHLPICRALPAAKNQVQLSGRDEAIAGQYRPCQQCNP